MKQLIKADFYRLLKDKTTLVAAILCAGVPLLFAGLFGLTFGQLPGDDLTALEIMFGGVTGIDRFISAFSINMSMAVIIFIFIIILFAKEFNHGTIRNKIVAGHSRNKIFFSNLIVMYAISFILVFIQAIFSFLFFSVFFGIGASKYTAGSFFKDLAFAVMLFVFAISMAYGLTMGSHSVGPAIAITAIMFILSSIFTSIAMLESFGEGLASWVRILLLCIPYGQNSYYFGRIPLENWEMFMMISLTLLYTFGFLLLGWTKFRKADLK